MGLLSAPIDVAFARQCPRGKVWSEKQGACVKRPKSGIEISKAKQGVAFVVSHDANHEVIGFGSGFFVSSDGLLVTNYHVIQRAHTVQVKRADGATYLVEGVVDVNPELDYVVLKLKGSGFRKLLLGDSERVRVGQDVVAIGNPHGLELTVSKGIISAIRTLGGDDHEMLQTDAAFSQGSSGGPLLDRKGRVVGIATLVHRNGQNLNFALPVNYVKDSLKKHSEVRFSLEEVAQWQRQQDIKAVLAQLPEYRIPMDCSRCTGPGIGTWSAPAVALATLKSATS